MTISEMYLPEFDEEMKKTRKMLERLPEEGLDYKPHEKSMTLGRLANHVAEMVGWATTTMQTESLELDSGSMTFRPQSRQEILDSFDKQRQEGRALLANASDEEFQKTWTLKFDGKQIMSAPRFVVLRGMVMNHMIHHRGQLSVYLRLKDLEIPGMYGPSADEMKFWEPQPA